MGFGYTYIGGWEQSPILEVGCSVERTVEIVVSGIRNSGPNGICNSWFWTFSAIMRYIPRINSMSKKVGLSNISR